MLKSTTIRAQKIFKYPVAVEHPTRMKATAAILSLS
jgi:hypothetical protein